MISDWSTIYNTDLWLVQCSHLADWRKLEEVTAHYQLNSSEWFVIVLDWSRHVLQLLEIISIHHGHLINDQMLALPPLGRHCLATRQLNTSGDDSCSWPDTSEWVEGGASDLEMKSVETCYQISGADDDEMTPSRPGCVTWSRRSSMIRLMWNTNICSLLYVLR